ncbi:hypothetical protein [Streptococcus mitis]|uniref:Uncharacterized protein n=1 Tax=Streptococcus mitis TaxID=28037 RepID=A0A1X1KYU0_STRMT|nr:hypothetical protein [Streptococcus mitis]ORP04500.1 hypothetical protein B7695_02830 [Streptococcus mitis]
MNETTVTRKCSKCHETKELSSENFYRRHSDKKGFSKVCKLCNKKKDAERYQKKKDKILTQKKRYYRRQKERQNEKGGLLEGDKK